MQSAAALQQEYHRYGVASASTIEVYPGVWLSVVDLVAEITTLYPSFSWQLNFQHNL